MNTALGGVTAGIAQAWQGTSFWKGFVRGAAGGSVVYSGKWTSTQNFFGAGLVGREVAAVGASMVANASEGRALLERVVLPVGPVRLHVNGTGANPLHGRVDLPNVISTVYTAALPNTRLDWSLTLSSGSPVFVHSGEQPWLGVHRAGVIVLKERNEMASTLFHERVHVVQYDFSATAWGEPGERWLLEQIPRGPTVHRYVALGLDNALWGGVRYLLPYDSQPWEWEARFFTAK